MTERVKVIQDATSLLRDIREHRAGLEEELENNLMPVKQRETHTMKRNIYIPK